MKAWLAGALFLAAARAAVAAEEPPGQLVNYVSAAIPNRNLNTGAYVETDFFYRLSRYWHVGGGIGAQYSTTKVNDLSRGRVVMVPILAKARAQIPGRYSAYAEAGVGFASLSHRLSVDVGRYCADRGFQCEESLENTVAGSLGGGVTAKVGDAMSIGVHLAYLFVEPRAVAKSLDNATGVTTITKRYVNLSTFQAGANFTIRF